MDDDGRDHLWSWLAQRPPAWSLLAGVPGGLIPVAGGRTLDEIGDIPCHHLALAGWSAAGVLVHNAPGVRVLVSGAAGGAAAYAGEELDPDPLTPDDLTAVALLWTLQDQHASVPELAELRLRLYTWLAVDREVAPHEDIAEAVADHDAGRLAHLAGLPLVDLERVPGRQLWNVAVIADLLPAQLPPFTSEAEYRVRLARTIPPRWLIADPIRRAGRADLAEVVVGTRGMDDVPF